MLEKNICTKISITIILVALLATRWSEFAASAYGNFGALSIARVFIGCPIPDNLCWGCWVDWVYSFNSSCSIQNHQDELKFASWQLLQSTQFGRGDSSASELLIQSCRLQMCDLDELNKVLIQTKKSSMHASTWLALGDIYMMTGNMADALEAWTIAGGDNLAVERIVHAGRTYNRWEMQDKGREAFEFAMLLEPTFPDPYYWAAYDRNLYFGIDDLALSLLRTGLLLDESNSLVFFRADSIFKLGIGDPEGAKASSIRALFFAPDDFSLTINYARALILLEETEEAIIILNRAKTLMESNSAPYWYLRQIYLDRDNLTSAIHEMETAVSIFPKDVQIRLDLAGMYQSANRMEDAIREFTIVLDLDPGNDTALEQLSKLK